MQVLGQVVDFVASTGMSETGWAVRWQVAA